MKVATQNFNNTKCIGEGRYWKQYEGVPPHANVINNGYVVLAKRFDRTFPQARHLFLTELKILNKAKHDNVVSLVGYCDEMDEMIIVYEHVLNGRLNKHLDSASLTWMRRLKICIDIACGVDFLHTGGVKGGILMIHRDLKSSSILLDGEWKAKISNLELSSQSSEVTEIEHVTSDNAYGSLSYVCPEYRSQHYLTKESDIYSLGVILVEIFCGRLSWDGQGTNLAFEFSIYTHEYLQTLVFPGIKEEIDPKSLTTFIQIVEQCVSHYKYDRPEARVVIEQLNKALELQEDHEIWEPKLPLDYKDIIRMSKNPETYNSIELKKDLYDKFSKGILLKDGNMLFSLGSTNEARKEMISARKFSYKNCTLPKWRSVQGSRFKKVAEMFDLSKLDIKINITTPFLSPGVSYGVYLIFKFCDTRRSSNKLMFVDLNYKMEGENMNAYFATRRDDNWMMIELFRSFSTEKHTKFEVLLEGFSKYYCGNSAIYVEGIEFRSFEDVTQKSQKVKEVQQVLKSKSKEEQLVSADEVDGKKHCMFSAMEVLYDSYMNRFYSEPAESRFQEGIELPRQQVFHISCEVKSQMLSLDTKYFCYLVFKLSEKCRGLYCPVKVQDLLQRKNKEAEIIYFKSPSSWNLHDSNSVPEQREDGWMEVKVWKFVTDHDFKKDCIQVNLKLITYKGTMFGLIVRGLEIRSS